MSNGPSLSKYYRLPGLHVSLPTAGAYIPEDSIEFSDEVEKELAILPMTGADEMMLKNPDALMAGNAVEMLFGSCVPGIKRPDMISGPDMDVLLLAIRVATYGKKMDVETDCPNCDEQLAFDCHLPSLLTSMKKVEPNAHVRLNDEIVAFLRPYTIRDISKLGRTMYDKEREMQGIEASNSSDEQKNVLRKALIKSMTSYRTQMIADTVIKVVVPEGEVTDRAEINGWMANTAAPWLKAIEDKHIEINSGGIEKTVPATCDKCGHEWVASVEFDPTTFFVQDSSR